MRLPEVDGDDDLIGANNPFSGVLLHRNDGSGVFEGLFSLVGGSSALDLTDVDGDGDLDLAWAEAGVGLSLNDGTGAFTDVTATHMPFAWSGVTAMAPGDLDGDGDADLLTSHQTVPDELWLNDGSGVFARAVGKLPVLPLGSNVAAFGDLDGDGDLDVVLAHLGALDHCRVLENDGTGGFAEVTATRLPGPTFEASDVVLADFDGDGDLDALFGRGPGGAKRLLLNDGAGVLTPAPGVAPWPSPIGIYSLGGSSIVHDIDGDGDPDVLGDSLLVNMHRQLETTSAALGRRWRISASVEPGYAAPGGLAVPLVAAGPAPAPLPIGVLGALRIDPATAVALPARAVPAPAGWVSWTLSIPAAPALLGQVLWTQAVVRHGGVAPVFRLTNAARARIEP